MDILETLESYTVAQMIVALPLLVVVWLILKEVRLMRTVKNSKSNSDGTVWAGAIGSLSEAVSGRFQEVSTVLQGFLISLQKHSQEHLAISTCLEALVTSTEGHSDEAKQRNLVLEALVEKTSQLGINVDATREAVNTMGSDLEGLKLQMDTAIQSLDFIKSKMEEKTALSEDSQALLKSFIEHAQRLEEALKKSNIYDEKVDTPPETLKVDTPPKEKKTDV